jgi:release factor glutamine methyltransferase
MDYDGSLIVEEDPLVYRPSEDSRLLLESIALGPGDRFLEVGTGTGLVALHAARHTWAVATDANRTAVELARANAKRNRVNLAVVHTNLAAGLRGPFDVIAFNPPYLEGRPVDTLDLAWAGGVQGSEVSVRFLADLPRILAPLGRAYLLLSHANAVAHAEARKRFRVHVAVRRKLFFEELEVVELTTRGPSRGSPTSRPSGRSRDA